MDELVVTKADLTCPMIKVTSSIKQKYEALYLLGGRGCMMALLVLSVPKNTPSVMGYSSQGPLNVACGNVLLYLGR